MDELNLLRKKTGMTFVKAWILMITAVILLFLSGGILGAIAGVRGENLSIFVEKQILWVLLTIILICSLWGFFINKKQLPSLKKTSLQILVISIIIALAYAYISPMIMDLIPMNEIESKNIERVGINLFLSLTLSLFFTTLQIGIIGHGLLKNYLFKQVIFTTAVVSMVMIIPQAVIGLALQTLIMFYIYYRTASFQLPLLMTAIFNILEDIFKQYFGRTISTQNYIRNIIIQNDTFYYMGFILCVCIIISGLYFIKCQTKPIAWQRPEEDENIVFL